MIKAMKSKGLKPIVALNHLTLPEWVLTPPKNFIKKLYQNCLPSPLRDLPIGDPPKNDSFWKSLRGWENYETVESFTKYVERVVQYLKDEVDYWITLGEPVASSYWWRPFSWYLSTWLLSGRKSRQSYAAQFN